MITNDNRLALTPAMFSFKHIFIEPFQFDTGKYIYLSKIYPPRLILKRVQTYKFCFHLYVHIAANCFLAVFLGTLLVLMK